MALSTGIISLNDVKTEIGLAFSNVGLQDCFANAVNQGYDPTYSGAKDRLSNFRGYMHSTIVLNDFGMDSTEYGSPFDACNFGFPFTTFYHNGAGIVPDVNDRVFIDQQGNTPFSGGGSFVFYLTDFPTVISIGATGFVLTSNSCI